MYVKLYFCARLGYLQKLINSYGKQKLDYVLKNVTESGGINYTINLMNQYKNEALSILQTFPEGEIKNGFADLVNFVTDRKY